jgi:hypothetical protein
LVTVVPLDVTTVTLTVPLPPGLVATILRVDSTFTLAAAVLPKRTFASRVKHLPVIVTLVPPAAGPRAMEIELIVGRCAIPHDGPGRGCTGLLHQHPASSMVNATKTTAAAERRGGNARA